MGIEYYQAVLRDGVRTYAEFSATAWKTPSRGILKWMPWLRKRFRSLFHGNSLNSTSFHSFYSES